MKKRTRRIISRISIFIFTLIMYYFICQIAIDKILTHIERTLGIIWKEQKMKLYELTEMYQALENLDLNEEELQTALNNINDEIELKADNIAKLIQSLDGDINAIKAEEERLYNKRKAIENRKESLKQYLQSAMIAVDKKKIKTELFSFNVQKNAPSLKIKDETKIPEDYYKIEKKLNKTDLKEAVKNGLFTDAAELIYTESLRIR